MQKGKIVMIPNTLGGDSIKDILPQEVIERVVGIRHFAVEEIKSARRLLRKMDREFPIDACTFFTLNKKTSIEELHNMLAVLATHFDLGVISEAGCPGIADPGADLVALAHQKGFGVVPLVGPSSILLALMASGFSGQTFTFHGYLPKERKDRIRKLKDFESDTRRNKYTHIFMDTPYRNMHMLEDLLNELTDNTLLCIASNITLPTESIKTKSIKSWREDAYDLSKTPTIFLIGSH